MSAAGGGVNPSPPFGAEPGTCLAACGLTADGQLFNIRVDAEGRPICAPTQLDIDDTALVLSALVVGFCVGWLVRMLRPSP